MPAFMAGFQKSAASALHAAIKAERSRCVSAPLQSSILNCVYLKCVLTTRRLSQEMGVNANRDVPALAMLPIPDDVAVPMHDCSEPTSHDRATGDARRRRPLAAAARIHMPVAGRIRMQAQAHKRKAPAASSTDVRHRSIPEAPPLRARKSVSSRAEKFCSSLLCPSTQGGSINDASEEGPRIAWFRESRESG
jgi:hypothetical protein